MNLQAPSRRQAFKEDCPDLPMPPEPVTTRWCTWIRAAIYYCDNFPKVKAVIDSFDGEEAEAIQTAQDMFADQSIKADLAYIKSNLRNW